MNNIEIYADYSGRGKTAFVVNTAKEFLTNDKNVLFLSSEMEPDNVLKRFEDDYKGPGYLVCFKIEQFYDYIIFSNPASLKFNDYDLVIIDHISNHEWKDVIEYITKTEYKCKFLITVQKNRSSITV